MYLRKYLSLITITNEYIYSMVCRILKHRVATYGQIARLVDSPRGVRQIGYAFSAFADDQSAP